MSRIAVLGAGSFGLTLAVHLERAGHEVRAFEHAEEAIAECTRWHPTVVCLDLNLPDLTGEEAITRLRRLAPDGRRRRARSCVRVACTANSARWSDHDG